MFKNEEFKKDILHKEIDLIQSCINRMANNSFLIKGWLIALITAVLAFGDKFTTVQYLCMVLIFPVIALWYLDTFFLQTERKYRVLYKWVIENRYKSESYYYDLNPDREDLPVVDSKFKTMFSKTLWPFYGFPLVVFIIIIMYKYNLGKVVINCTEEIIK